MDFKLKKSVLNFQVYAAPSVPETGNENDICIISEVPMKNWILSPDSPGGAPRNDGDVWIQYSVTGRTRNVVKTDTILLAMTSVYQYASGAWNVVPSYIFGDGSWVDLNSVLWNADTNFENVAVLGSKGFYITAENAGREGYGTITKDQNGLVLNSNNNSNIVSVSHDNKIDFAQKQTLTVAWSGGNAAETYQGIGIFRSTNTVQSSDAIRFYHKDNTAEETVSYDISDINEKAYLVIIAFNGALTIKQIKLE